jgi:tetratricopeptide (TPR) repeat protein
MNDRIEKLKSFLSQSPADPFLNHALALEYIKLGNDTEARSLFEKNLSDNPDYLATYYHLGKLLERAKEQEGAIQMYEKGMVVAKSTGDNHTYNELQGAYEDLVY